jgi:hypothetical protein
MGAIFYFFYLPETKGKSLEEIAEIFGDTLATANLGDINVAAKQDVTEIEHAENSDGTNRDQMVLTFRFQEYIHNTAWPSCFLYAGHDVT